jgi:hypothetical protein
MAIDPLNVLGDDDWAALFKNALTAIEPLIFGAKVGHPPTSPASSGVGDLSASALAS